MMREDWNKVTIVGREREREKVVRGMRDAPQRGERRHVSC